MSPDELETKMRRHEYFHSMTVPDNMWIVIRVDGHSFSRLTENLEKPFDMGFHRAMLKTAETLLEKLNGSYAYTESDEISLLLHPMWGLFDREVEKLVSISAGIASSAFTKISAYEIGGLDGHFDSRIWMAATRADVVDYFRWRQADAERCALNGWAYWTLRKTGMSARQATAELKNKGHDLKHQALFSNGINFNNLPSWQKRGSGLYYEIYEKEALNPQTNTIVKAMRRRVKIDENLPMKDDYSRFIDGLLSVESDAIHI